MAYMTRGNGYRKEIHFLFIEETMEFDYFKFIPGGISYESQVYCHSNESIIPTKSVQFFCTAVQLGCGCRFNLYSVCDLAT
jgi:hypothetical protein